MNLNLSRRRFAAGAALLPLACARAGDLVPSTPTSNAPTPLNPLVRQRADAQVFRHEDGFYYLTGSVPEYDRLVLRRSRTLAGLADAEERVLWRHEATGPLSGFIWAPELHFIDGLWVMYFAAGPSGGGEDVFRIRTYAVACRGSDPMIGDWSILGQFNAPWDTFCLDSTSFVHRGTRYFAWAQREPGIETNSNLYLAPMKDALTLSATPVRLSAPTLDWEIRGFKVNEAPAVLHRNGRLFMTYSASATDARYCLGLLTADESANLLDLRSWTKAPEPVFVSCRETSVFGPGHNSFTVDEQGRDVLVYHGRDYEAISGDPLFDPNRHTRVQRLYYDAAGAPDFGVPVGNGAIPDRYESAIRRGTWLSCDGTGARASAAPLPQTQLRAMVRFDGSVALAPILSPARALVVEATGALAISTPDAPGAAFERVAGPGGTVQLLSRTRPGNAVGLRDERLALVSATEPSAFWYAR